MTEEAEVARISGRAVYVTLKRKPQCNTCKACSFGSEDSITVPAISRIECSVGDRVKIKMPEVTASIAPLIMYGVPLVMMIIGALIGLIFSETLAILLAFTFLGISVIIGYLLDKLVFQKKSKYVPQIIEKINKHK